MNPSHRARFLAYARYLSVFLLGGLCSFLLLFQLGFLVTPGMSSIEDQAEDHALNTSVDAVELATVLSQFKMNERNQATQRLEKMLDAKTGEVGILLPIVKDAKIAGRVNRSLGFVKWYRDVVPSQTPFKREAEAALSQIPNLKEPLSRPDSQRSALARFHVRYRNHAPNH